MPLIIDSLEYTHHAAQRMRERGIAEIRLSNINSFSRGQAKKYKQKLKAEGHEDHAKIRFDRAQFLYATQPVGLRSVFLVLKAIGIRKYKVITCWWTDEAVDGNPIKKMEEMALRDFGKMPKYYFTRGYAVYVCTIHHPSGFYKELEAKTKNQGKSLLAEAYLDYLKQLTSNN